MTSILVQLPLRFSDEVGWVTRTEDSALHKKTLLIVLLTHLLAILIASLQSNLNT